MPDFPELPRRPERGGATSGQGTRHPGAGGGDDGGNGGAGGNGTGGGDGGGSGGPMRFASLGLELVAYVVVAGGIGFAIDKWRGGGTAWTVGGLVFGLVGGSVRFVRAALRAIREE